MAEFQVDAEGFIVKTDYTDVGARMRPAVPGVTYEHPEDAHSPSPKRGDYSQKTQPRVHYRRGTINVFGEYVVDGRGEGSHG